MSSASRLAVGATEAVSLLKLWKDSQTSRILTGQCTVNSVNSIGFFWKKLKCSRWSTNRHAPAFTRTLAEASRGTLAMVSTVEVEEGKNVDELQRTWSWKLGNEVVPINYVQHRSSSKACDEGALTLLLLPALSDVATVDEWRSVAKRLVQQDGRSCTALVVDWPGFGGSGSPPIEYTADVLENFLVDFVTSQNSPLPTKDIVIVGAGHSATIAIKAIAEEKLKAAAVAAVAPTWGGPLPIVFGHSSEMQFRYGLLRGALRAPVVGPLLYGALTSKKSIGAQYRTHVYQDASNISDDLLDARIAVTRREGARFAPASFLSGRLDPVQSREEWLQLYASLKLPTLVISSRGSPRRSKAEMDALKDALGVSKYVQVEGALLPHEEYPDQVTSQLRTFLASL